MLKRIYIHNYRCFQNFEMSIDSELKSYLFLGKNGAGKSNLVNAINILKRIGEGTVEIAQLINQQDFNLSLSQQSMVIEVDVELNKHFIQYKIHVDFPETLKRAKVTHETLSCNGVELINRMNGDISYQESAKIDKRSEFFLDWHMIALPLINTRIEDSPVALFKDWLSKIVVLSPIPALMKGESHNADMTLKPNVSADNIASWLTGLFSDYPETYSDVMHQLTHTMPDLASIRNNKTAENSRKIVLIFEQASDTIAASAQHTIDFDWLSYGEKIFLLATLLTVSTKVNEVSLCVWDEPDNYVSLVEMQTYFHSIKQAFTQSSAQFFATTHNPEAIRAFSSESTYVMSRDSHLQPTRIRLLSEDNPESDVVESIKLGLIEL